MLNKTIQSLPRELHLPSDGVLRIRPLKELESLRFDKSQKENVVLDQPVRGHGDRVPPVATPSLQSLIDIPSEAAEVRLVIPHEEVYRKLFGLVLFSDGKGGGLPIVFRPETGTVRVGNAEIDFSAKDLAEGEDLEIRIFIDKYLIEVFVGDRAALVASFVANEPPSRKLDGFTVGAPTRIRSLESWKLQSTTEGFHRAQQQLNWKPQTE